MLEKLAAWAYLNVIGGNRRKSGETNLIFLVLCDAACWYGFVYVGSVSGIPASSCDNRR